MNTLFILLSFLLGSPDGDPLQKLLKSLNNETVPYVYVNQVESFTSAHLLDSRETREFEVSHLKGAECVGYDHFKLKTVLDLIPNKLDTVIVYCSLGIRSEDIGEKLQDAGYTNVFNLYGGIFEWKNDDKVVYNSKEEVTEEVHEFSKDWGKWLHKGIKIYQ